MAGNTPQYYGSIPVIQKAFENAPASKLAQSMIATGTSTAPVATGSWGVPDGIARAAQAIVGALVQKKQEKKFSAREKDYQDALVKATNALDGGGVGAPAMGAPIVAPPVAPLVPPMAPDAPQAPMGGIAQAATALASPAPPAPPQGAMGAPPAMSASPPPGMPPSAPPAGFVPPSINGQEGVVPPSRLFPTNGGPSTAKPNNPMAASAMFSRGIVPIEGGTNRDGSFRTSPKGAVGPAQVMPGTAREAARLAGLEYDEQKYRTDPQYNLALGNAYFSAQLQKFGDPLKAAAAYNGGAGRVMRAMRVARINGSGDWQNARLQNGKFVLPEETRNYVTNFAAKIGGAYQNDGGDIAATNVTPPTMEAIPEGPQAVERPNAPILPDKVQNTRLATAQALLRSGNPDLVSMAQDYLDKGLNDEQTNRATQNEQQFKVANTGFESDLTNFRNASSDARQNNYQERQQAESRNFTRETGFVDRTFRAGESAADREARMREGALDRGATRSNLEYSESMANQRNTQNNSSRETVADKRATQRNSFFSTPAGSKLLSASQDEIGKLDVADSQLQEFATLNEKSSTGGIRGVPIIGGIAQGVNGAFDSNVSRMNQIASDETLSRLGGSLGVAISDGDRKFLEGSSVSVGAPKERNDTAIAVRRAAIMRRRDYLTSQLNAQADGTMNNFVKDWNNYTRSISIMPKVEGPTGKTRPYVSFDEWQAITKGRRVQ